MTARRVTRRRAKRRPLLHENDELRRLSALGSTLLHAGLAARSAKESHARVGLLISDLLALLDLVNARMEAIKSRPGRKRDEKAATKVRSAAIWVLKELASRPKREEKRLKAMAVERFVVRADALRKEVTIRRRVLRSMADELGIPPIPEGTDDDQLLKIVSDYDEARSQGPMVLQIAEEASKMLYEEALNRQSRRRQKLR